MRVYAKAVRRRQRLPAGHLAAFDRALQWAQIGANGDFAPSEVPERIQTSASESASERDKLDASGA